MHIKRKMYVNNDLDIVTTRMQARQVAKEMGFSTADQARISLAASELARVICWNGSGPGELVMSNARQNGHEGLQVTCLVDLEYVPTTDKKDWAEEPSVASRSLAGACQLVDESLVEEHDNDHAQVTLIKWLK